MGSILPSSIAFTSDRTKLIINGVCKTVPPFSLGVRHLQVLAVALGGDRLLLFARAFTLLPGETWGAATARAVRL